MPDYLYVLRMPDDSWALATRQGHLVTAPDYELPAGAPRIAVHPQLSVPTVPLAADECACCAALAFDHQQALDAGTPSPS